MATKKKAVKEPEPTEYQTSVVLNAEKKGTKFQLKWITLGGGIAVVREYECDSINIPPGVRIEVNGDSYIYKNCYLIFMPSSGIGILPSKGPLTPAAVAEWENHEQLKAMEVRRA